VGPKSLLIGLADRRWASGEYERWLADVLVCSLLSPTQLARG
jgi:hypothetical protein